MVDSETYNVNLPLNTTLYVSNGKWRQKSESKSAKRLCVFSIGTTWYPWKFCPGIYNYAVWMLTANIIAASILTSEKRTHDNIMYIIIAATVGFAFDFPRIRKQSREHQVITYLFSKDLWCREYFKSTLYTQNTCKRVILSKLYKQWKLFDKTT